VAEGPPEGRLAHEGRAVKVQGASSLISVDGASGIPLAGWSPTGGGTKGGPSALPPRPSAHAPLGHEWPCVARARLRGRGRAPGHLVEILLPSMLPRSNSSGGAVWRAAP
jgi:hypothetical protein